MANENTTMFDDNMSAKVIKGDGSAGTPENVTPPAGPGSSSGASPNLTTTDQIEQDNVVKSPSPNDDGQLKSKPPGEASAQEKESPEGEEDPADLTPLPSQKRVASGVGPDTPYASTVSPPEPNSHSPMYDASKPMDDPANKSAQAQATATGVGGALIDPNADLHPQVALTAARHRSSLLRTTLANVGNVADAPIELIKKLLEELTTLVGKL